MDAPSSFNIPNMTLASITGSHHNGQTTSSASATTSGGSGAQKKGASAKLRFDDNVGHDAEQDTPEERQQRILQRRLRIDQHKAGHTSDAAHTTEAASESGQPLELQKHGPSYSSYS